jgi:hypothetical protein
MYLHIVELKGDSYNYSYPTMSKMTQKLFGINHYYISQRYYSPNMWYLYIIMDRGFPEPWYRVLIHRSKRYDIDQVNNINILKNIICDEFVLLLDRGCIIK